MGKEISTACRGRGMMRVVLGAVLILIVLAAGTAMAGTEPKVLRFDRAALHAQAVEESLVPIRPGVPGKTPFWNARARQFMYAPAFEFKPVQGATAYRFTATAYGPGWSVETTEPKASLEPIWKDLPEGKLELQFVALGAKRGDVLRITGPAEYQGKWITKVAGEPAPSFEFAAVEGARAYRVIVRQPREYVFEADEPWASLAPIWKELPVGKVQLSAQGLDKKGGKVLGNSGSKEFERKAVFGGPYHEAAFDYTEAGTRWLRWLADGPFKRWVKEGDPQKLQQYPCKYEAAAVDGLTALAALEPDPAKRDAILQMARNAARTLIKGSFPADWGLAHFPPTYSAGGGYLREIVMTQYPATAGLAYLDLYAATKEKEFLEAAVRIADVYKRTQLPNGEWHLLMDARTGEKAPKSVSPMVPYVPLKFLDRLIREHGMAGYRPVAEAAWKWLDAEIIQPFRFEGQFEDTTAGGSSQGNLSHWSACAAAELLFLRAKEKPELVALAEDALRLAEDQFVIWEQPPHPDQFTPCALEQYRYMVSIQSGAAQFIGVYRLAYEVTGKELYLAKSVAFANAMTVLQKEGGGLFVNTYWRKPINLNDWGDWPNCHEHSARALLRLGDFLRERGLRVPVAVPEHTGGD